MFPGRFHRPATKAGTNGRNGCCPAVQHPRMPEESCTPEVPHVNSRTLPSRPVGRTALAVGVGVAAAGVVAALLNRWLARRAERRNPPIGRFITVKGVRLHYVDRGAGIPLVLLHGNGSMIEDFKSSGLLDQAAKKYRVIAFDRPGFGHSERPRGIVWSPQAQAHLIAAALMEIGVSKPIVLGHSWGTLVAVALALQYPREVRALILASGYYFPGARTDVVISSPAALPVIGNVLSHTISPLLSRLIWPLLLRKIFGPSSVPDKFVGFPEEMAVRPGQLRAAAAESALMIPAARTLRNRYRLLEMPVIIVAGAQDQFIESDHSRKLHREIPDSILRLIPSNGHMVHQTATSEVLTAIDTAANHRRAETTSAA
jgi:pimeloyl-ACP methyl ester carboxylesterase